jgi:hypothetical protein
MRSRRNRRRLPSTAARKRSGRPSGCQSPAPGPYEARFGRNDEIRRIRIQRLRNQSLRDFGPVRIRSVDDRDAELDGGFQDRNRLVVVGRLAPNAGPRDAHCAKAEPMHRKIAANRKGAARGRRAKAGLRGLL